MAAAVGRTLTLTYGGAAIAGARTKTITINGTPVDITSDDDSGYRTLLEASGEKQIDMSIEGLAKDDVLVEALANNGTLIAEAVLTLPSGATITGDFRLNSVELGAPYNDAVTFTAELQSTGSWAMAPVSG